MGIETQATARTRATAARLLTSEVDPRGDGFMMGEPTPEGLDRICSGLECAIAQAESYVHHGGPAWCAGKTSDLTQVGQFAEAVPEEHLGKVLAFRRSPSCDGNS